MPRHTRRAMRAPSGGWTALLSDVFAGLAGSQLLVSLGLPMLLRAGAAALLLVAGGLAGAFARTSRRRAWLVGLDAGLLIAWLVLGFTRVIDAPVAGWVRDDALDGRRGAVVVLSSSVQPDSSLDGAGTDRLLAGLALLHAGAGDRLVTTRTVITSRGSQIGSEFDQRRLAAMRRTAGSWLELGTVGSTRDEAVAAARAMLPLGWRDIILVTTPLHTRRACAAFEHEGFRVTCHASRERRYAFRALRPGGERLAAFRDYVYERLATVKYRRNGWL